MSEFGQNNDDELRMFHLMQDVGLGNDTEMCQYMDLDYLMAILKTDKYYVKRKELFTDQREKSIPYRLMFEPRPINDKLSPEHIKKIDNSIKTAHYFSESSSLLTSCWTERITENALMWDRGGERHRACILSRVGDFVSAFENTNLHIWCGRIIYEPLKPLLLSEDIIWYKEPYFSDEREIRFYFSSEFSKIVSDKGNNSGLLIPVNKELLIHEIVLSPYINKSAAEKLKQSITETFGIKTTLSKIEVS